MDDIDGTLRAVPWNMGADELGLSARNPAISSAGNQSFTVGSAPIPALTITILEDSVGGNITSADDIRIRIPSSFNMRWDTSVATVTLIGGAAGRVDTSIKAYEDRRKTVVLEVSSDFFANDDLQVDGLAFTNFAAPSLLDNLELEARNDGFGSALDDKTIAITAAASPTISSDADQAFSDGAPPALASPITVSDAAAPVIVPGNDISIVIPAVLIMTWDGAFNTPSFAGPAATKVDPVVAFINGDKTLVITVNTPFAIGDYLVVTDTDDKSIDIFVTGAVKVFTATSTNIKNHLEWVNPDDLTYDHTRVLARDDGIFPSDPLDLVNARLVIDHFGTRGQKASVDDGGLNNDTTYYYTAFAFDGAQYSGGARPPDARSITFPATSNGPIPQAPPPWHHRHFGSRRRRKHSSMLFPTTASFFRTGPEPDTALAAVRRLAQLFVGIVHRRHRENRERCAGDVFPVLGPTPMHEPIQEAKPRGNLCNAAFVSLELDFDRGFIVEVVARTLGIVADDAHRCAVSQFLERLHECRNVQRLGQDPSQRRTRRLLSLELDMELRYPRGSCPAVLHGSGQCALLLLKQSFLLPKHGVL